MSDKAPISSPAGPEAAIAGPGSAAASSEVFRAVADNTYDWESWIDAEGQLVWVNPAVERMTGYGASECFRMQSYPLPLVHPDDREAVARLLRSATAGGSGNDFEFRIVTKQGETRWLAVSWQGLQQGDGVPLGYRTSVRDIHERKLAERRLQDAMRSAEQAASMRRDFLANMSHELRTPLQCIVGYAQLLQEELTDPRQRHFAETIVGESEAMLRIVGNVLELSSLEAVEMPLEERTFDPVELIEGCVRAARPLADEKGLSLTTKVRRKGLPNYVVGDDLRIRQVLVNLIGNAIKFTNRGRVVVSLSGEPIGSPRNARGAAAHDRRILRLSVADTGVGMSEAVVARLFTPFYQAEGGAARRHGGTGLGLAISQRLCEHMGGTIRVETREGRGSTFFVELPVTAATALSERPPSSRTEPERAGSTARRPSRSPRMAPSLAVDAAQAGAAPREPPHAEQDFAERHPLSILVVDDSPAVLELTTEFLRLLGYRPESASSGKDAVNAATAQGFDLILMDLHIPDMDGMTAARLIRAHQPSRGPRSTIVALTANPFARAQALSSEGGMDGFMTKPLVFSDLKELLARVANRQELDLTDPQRPAAHLDERVIEDLRTTSGSDGRPLLHRLAARVLEDGRSLLKALRSAVAAQDGPALRQLAHRLKGNALLVGATDLARQCQRLEDWADTERAAAQAGIVEEAQTALEEALRRELARL